mmetsp:Transcript_32278/g.74566  ORF Transcript_32278/g.74566 Transcript_32278/m.74566 type:complete len:516 (-) Transcript_32278:71-1618(-)
MPKKRGWSWNFLTAVTVPAAIGFYAIYHYAPLGEVSRTAQAAQEPPIVSAPPSQIELEVREVREVPVLPEVVEPPRQDEKPTPPTLPMEESQQSFPEYGFYLHVYADPAAVIYQVRELRKFFPDSPIYMMSDGGLDFSRLCSQEGCEFVLCPPANDRWHPWPFFHRLWDAANSLKVKYVVMLEPDNTIHGYPKRPPTADLGGLFVEGRQFGLVRYVEKLAQDRAPGFKWTKNSMSSGLCGGAYFRREAILDALSDENMMKLDWNYLGDRLSKEIFSSDFAMQYAFAARGWKIEPWIETAQMDRHPEEPLTGAKDSAFRHYCSCYPGGKPTYNLKVAKTDQKLFKDSGYQMTSGPYSSSVCQLCYNHSRYLKLWGSARCTNAIPFQLSEKLLKRHHPEMDKKPCNLDWLCEPGKMRGRGVDVEGPTASPPDPQAKYILLDHATASCPPSTKALESVTQCKAAAGKLEKRLAYEDELYQENDPKGCVFRVPDNDMYFNDADEGTPNSGRRLVCQEVR